MKVTLKPVSDKRKSTTKLRYNSTFTAKEFRGRKTRSAKTERQQWKDKADKYFSEFIRLRDSDEQGMVTCVTCSHRGHWRQLQNGHWITRGHEATRFDELNCNTQCRGCNYNGGQHLRHEAAIVRKHGAEAVQKLTDKARATCHRTALDYKFLAETYRSRVEHIRKNSPGKFRA